MSNQFMVELVDGQTFGPADEATLRAWANEGRIPPVANIRAGDGTACRAIDFGPIRDVMARVASAPPMGAGPLQPAADTATSVIIPYKNVPALVGYYVSVASLIPVAALLLGPAAVILGVIGLKKVKAEPRAHGTAHAWVAIALGSITFLAHVALIVVGIASAR